MYMGCLHNSNSWIASRVLSVRKMVQAVLSSFNVLLGNTRLAKPSLCHNNLVLLASWAL